MWETWVRSLNWEDSLEKEMATHSYILAWRIPRTEEPGWLCSTGSERIGHDWVANTSNSVGKWEMCSMAIFLLLIWKEMICSSCPPDPSVHSSSFSNYCWKAAHLKNIHHRPVMGREKKCNWCFPNFPVVMYGCESWTIKKAEHRRIDVFELLCWRRLLRVPWTARRSNQSIRKEISHGCSLEGLMLKLKLQYFGHLMQRADSFEKTLMLGKIEGRRRRGW